jgi:hypothetical protein
VIVSSVLNGTALAVGKAGLAQAVGHFEAEPSDDRLPPGEGADVGVVGGQNPEVVIEQGGRPFRELQRGLIDDRERFGHAPLNEQPPCPTSCRPQAGGSAEIIGKSSGT